MQSLLRQISPRIKALWNRPLLDRDMDDEKAFHLAMRENKNRAAALDAEEARYAARRQFGNLSRAKEMSREMWAFTFLETRCQTCVSACVR